MEIKLLTTEQLPEAAGLARGGYAGDETARRLARGVFDYCLRNSINNPKMVQAFEQYSHQDYLKHMMEENYLVIWGAYEQGTIVGMSAMQTEGHITMLYVHPMYQRRGIGKKLLEEMRKYAKSVYNLSIVTVNAMPVWTENYFARRKFSRMNVMPNNDFVSMQAAAIDEVTYEKKPLSTGVVLSVVFGSLFFCILAVVIGLVQLIG